MPSREIAMDLRQLRYFVKVVECGNITRAAGELHIAQPAVSQQIRNLESHLEMQLFERHMHGVIPTAAGKTLYRHAVKLLHQADATRELLRQDAEFPTGRVSVGVPSSTARALAIPLVSMVRERYPGIVLELLEVPSADLSSMIGSGRVDLAVVVDAGQHGGVAAQKLMTEALYLISWPEVPVFSGPVSLVELSRVPLVLPRKPNTIRMRVDEAMDLAGLSCEILFEASSTTLMFTAVMAKLGMTVLPWSAAHAELREGRLKLTSIGHPMFSRELSLCWQDADPLSNAVQKVRDIILELFHDFQRSSEWALDELDRAPHHFESQLCKA